MASTAAGQALTQKFRWDQLSIRAHLLKRALALWPLLDVRRLDATSPEWTRAMVAEVLASRMESARSASSYYEQVRALELPAAAPWRARWLHDAPPADDKAITTSLLVTGPVNVKTKTARLLATPDRPAVDKAIETVGRDALIDVSGAMTRHVLDGGREVLREEGARDHTALAFARISDGSPCYFCALMISRGFVYRSKDTAGRTASSRFDGEGLYKFHDHCACTVEPVFTPDARPSAAAERYDQIYRDAHGEAARLKQPVMTVFRRRFEAAG